MLAKGAQNMRGGTGRSRGGSWLRGRSAEQRVRDWKGSVRCSCATEEQDWVKLGSLGDTKVGAYRQALTRERR